MEPKSILKQAPFEVFDLKPGLEIDPLLLEKKYIHLLQAFHPDRTLDLEEKTIFQAVCEHVQRARKQIEGFRERAETLLQQAGGKSAREDKTTPDGFLQEILQLNEDLEDGALQEHTLLDRISQRESNIANFWLQGDLDAMRTQLNAYIYEANLYDQWQEQDDEDEE